LHPDEGVQQAQAVNSAKKDATTARRAPAINRPRNVVTVPQNNVARTAHANQSYGDHRRKVGNSCSAPGARAETRDELCNSGCCYKPLYRDFLTTARSTCIGSGYHFFQVLVCDHGFDSFEMCGGTLHLFFEKPDVFSDALVVQCDTVVEVDALVLEASF